MKYNDILVSIVIPTYNGEKYINGTIASIRKQTHSNIEILVINDGSTDRSQDILESLSKNDARIKVYNILNSGISAARNHGIAAARGKYIMFCDHDDTVDEYLIEESIDIAETNSCDVVKYGHCVIYPNKIQNCTFKVEEKILLNNYSLCDVYPMIAKKRMNVYVWDALYNMDYIRNNRLRFIESLKNGEEDRNFNLDLLRCAPKIVVNPKIYYQHYVRTTSTTRKYSKNRVEAFFLTLRREEQFVLDYNIDQSFWKNEKIHKTRDFMDYIAKCNYKQISQKKKRIYIKKYLCEAGFSYFSLSDIISAFKESVKQGLYAICLKYHMGIVLFDVLSVTKLMDK